MMSSSTSSDKPVGEKAFTFKKRVAIPVVEVPSSGEEDDDFKPSRHRRRQFVSAEIDDGNDNMNVNLAKKSSGKSTEKVTSKTDKKPVSKVKKGTKASDSSCSTSSSGTSRTIGADKTFANTVLPEFHEAEGNDNSEALAQVNLRSVTPEFGTNPDEKAFETDDIEFVCTIASASSSAFSGSVDRDDGKEAWKKLMSKMQTSQTSSKISKKGKISAKRGLTKNSNGMMKSNRDDLVI